jgi:hypothetical protein
VRATLHALLALLIFTGSVEVWQIVVIEVLFGTAEAFFRPAYTGLIPRTVPADEIQEAQALSNLTYNLSTLTGPAIATALVVGVGAGWAFAVDAATFAVSGLLLTRVSARDEPPAARERSTLLADLTEGFEEVRSRTWLWVTVVVFALAIPLGYAPLFVLGPTIAADGYGSAAMFGLVTTLSGAGALSGAVLGMRWRPRHPMRAAYLVLGAWPLMLVSFAAGAPRPVVLLLSAATGAGFALFTIWWDTAMAERIPPHALSRASSYEWMGSLILLPVGYLLSGPAADAASPETVMTAGGLLAAAILSLGLIPRQTRMLRSDV